MEKPEMITPEMIQNNDKLIALIGPTGCGKSHFIDHLTQLPAWANKGLNPVADDVRAIRVRQCTRLFEENIILIDTPGFDDPAQDYFIFDGIRKWLQRFNNLKLTGILYLHRINDNRMTATSHCHLHSFGRMICGENPAQGVVFVTTMWDKIPADKGEKREVDLRENYWEPLLRRGAQMGRFYQSQDSACAVVKLLIDSVSRASREGVPDRRLVNFETKAIMEGFNELQPLLLQHREIAAAQVQKEGDSRASEDLAKQDKLIQAELDEGLDEGVMDLFKSRRPPSRRFTIFSLKARGNDT